MCSCPREKCVGQQIIGMCVHTCVQCAFGVNVSEYCADLFVCYVKDGIDNLISFLLTVCDI